MAAFALALAAEAAVRAASLNLCTDEYLLLLARPEQIVSVSHLSRDPLESVLWQRARHYPANDGSLESVARARPSVIVTMGGLGRGRAEVARKLGIRLIELPFPSTPEEVLGQAKQVAEALGRHQAVQPFEAKLRDLAVRRLPLRKGALLSGGGLSAAPDGLAAGWLAFAGYRQPALPGNRLTLERLATRPPKWLIRSDYRTAQASRPSAWLRHPLVSRLAARTIVTDGRPWTCGGLPMLNEVERLRSLRR